MDSPFQARDAYIKYIPEQGTPSVRYHRVWDLHRFMSVMADAGKRGNSPEDRFTIELAVKPPFRTQGAKS